MALRQQKSFIHSHLDCDCSNIKDYFDVIIAAKENVEVIRHCLKRLKAQSFKNVYLCIDGGSIDTLNCLRKEFPDFSIVLNEGGKGKINAQIICLNQSSRPSVLLMDADIELIDKEIEEFLNYYMEHEIDFVCPYSKGLYQTINLLSGVAESDRHMRQRIVRAGRDRFNVSNLSGYCMIANRVKYLEVIDSNAIQDDVAATINMLKKKLRVKTYHRTVCSEIERSSFKSFILQKTRWTAGNLLLLNSYSKLFAEASLKQSLAFTSSFLLWYWSNWIDFISFIFAFMYPPLFIVLGIEGLIKFYGLNKVKSPSENPAVLQYILLWPVISIICLILSPYYISGLITEKSTRR